MHRRFMRIFPLVGILSSSTIIAHAKYDLRSLGADEFSAKDVGAIHTEAFEELSRKYSVKKPTSKNDLITDMRHILYDYCVDGDSSCKEDADEALDLANPIFNGADIESYFPGDIDPRLVDALKETNATLYRLNEENLDESIEALKKIQEKTEEIQDVNIIEKTVVLSSLYVGIESAQFWHKAAYDPNHPLHFLFVPEGRRLQTCGEGFGLRLVFWDIIGALTVLPYFLTRVFGILLIVPLRIRILASLIGVNLMTILLGLTVTKVAFRSIAFSLVAAGMLSIQLLWCIEIWDVLDDNILDGIPFPSSDGDKFF